MPLTVRKTIPNKHPGQCCGCLGRVVAGAGAFEVVEYSSRDQFTRVRCADCVAAGRDDAHRDQEIFLAGDLGNQIGLALSDDPTGFLVFHDGRWKLALDREAAQAFIAMILGGALARDH